MAIDLSDIQAEKALVRLALEGRVSYALLEKGRLRLYEGSPFMGGKPGRKTVDPAKARLLPPCRPSKVPAVGLNYRAHAAEMKMQIPAEPLLFLKPSSTVIGPHQPILRPLGATRVDYEAELGVVIGRRCSRVSAARALDYVLGYTCLNDVTERHVQHKDVQFCRAKSFDTFCPLGPAIALDLDPRDLAIKATLNGETRQASRTSDLIFDVAALVEFISGVMTLHPGDVIATGTPAGVGPMQAGDQVTIELEGIAA